METIIRFISYAVHVSIFHYVYCNSSYGGMSSVCWNSIQLVSMNQTIKYYLKTRGLSSASFYDASQNDYVMNLKLYRNMKFAPRKRVEDISMEKRKRAEELEKLNM